MLVIVGSFLMLLYFFMRVYLGFYMDLFCMLGLLLVFLCIQVDFIFYVWVSCLCGNVVFCLLFLVSFVSLLMYVLDLLRQYWSVLRFVCMKLVVILWCLLRNWELIFIMLYVFLMLRLEGRNLLNGRFCVLSDWGWFEVQLMIVLICLCIMMVGLQLVIFIILIFEMLILVLLSMVEVIGVRLMKYLRDLFLRFLRFLSFLLLKMENGGVVLQVVIVVRFLLLVVVSIILDVELSVVNCVCFEVMSCCLFVLEVLILILRYRLLKQFSFLVRNILS